jgi:hypothetical protein
MRWLTIAVIFAGLMFTGSSEARERLLLTGVVLDTSSAAIAGASLTAMDENTGLRYGAASGTDGVYALTLPAGSYKVTVRKPGFCTVAKLNLLVGPGPTSRSDFVLPVGNFRETITIAGEPELTNTTDASVGGLAGRRWIETLPLNGRGILSLIDLAPGVLATPASNGEAGQFTVNGQRPNTNYFTVDGISGNNTVTGGSWTAQFAGATLPGMTAFGSTQNLAPVEALEEVRILTSTFAPEYGRMPGAHVALTTRSGTDQIHGTAFFNFRHETLAANDWFANSLGLGRAPSRLHYGGGSLGGPVKSGRTYYFAAAESLRLVHSATWSMLTPSSRARQSAPDRLRPLLDLFPLPTGPGTAEGVAEASARAVRPASMQSLNLRLDHALTSRLSLFGTFQQTPSSTDFGFLQVDSSKFNSRRVTIGAIGVYGSLINEMRFGWSQSSAQTQSALGAAGGAIPVDLRRYLPATEGANATIYAISIGGLGQVVAGDSGRNRQRQLHLSDTLSARLGSHALRGGIEYLRINPERLSATARVTGSYATIGGLLNGDAPLITRTLAEPATSRIELLSLFVQDTWRPHARLSLTYGGRWELTPPPSYMATGTLYPFGEGRSEPTPAGLISDPGDSVSNTPAGGIIGSIDPALPVFPAPSPTSVQLWPSRYGQIAPRAGAAFQVTPKSIIRAGWGLFFDTGFSAALDPINGYAFNRRQLASGGGSELTFVSAGGYAAAANLTLPRTWQWNLSWENDWGRAGILTASYVGASGHQLLRREGTLLSRGATDLSTSFQVFGSAVATNHGESQYRGLQLHYRRQWRSGLRANASYAISRSTDNGSWDSALYLVMPERGFTADRDRGPSSFDIAHSVTAALSYPLGRRGPHLLRGWSLDSMVRLRTGFPIDVRNTENLLGLGFDNLQRPSLVNGQPVWLTDANVPGGRRLDPAAFAPISAGGQGSLGRNALRGFGMSQADVALRRTFVLSERAGIEFRAEVFNLLNRASPGDPVPYLQDARFGRSISMLNLMMGSGAPHSGLTPAFQTGGTRTAQLQLRLRF